MGQRSATTEHPDHAVARQLWQALEPVHALVYFAPEARAAYAGAGLKGYWMGYFASRSAAIGAVPASVVTATFYNFHPSMVARSIPDAWRFSTAERVLAARLSVADAALRRICGAAIGEPAMREAADLAREATIGCDVAGRALFAGHRSLAWPDEPHLALWHAATLLREYRGDGHVASLLSAGLDGCEAHVSLVASGATTREAIQPHRGWTDEEWSAAEARLEARGWLTAEGHLTPAGASGRQAIEDRTDSLAMPPWEHLGAERCARLRDLATTLSRAIVAQDGMPFPNPLGLPRPE